MTWRGPRWLRVCGGAAIAAPLALLVYLLADVLWQAWPQLTWDFARGGPSRVPAHAGMWPAIVGTIALMALTTLTALPIGVGAAIYLEEYAHEGRLMRLIELNLANLAAVPSIIYGLLGLSVFVRGLGLGRSLLAGALTLSLLVLPLLIIASREALRAVPSELREAALALGASRWQVIRQIVLPHALPGLMTGCILALSRAAGETAPLIVVGAVTYITFAPTRLSDPFTAMPIQIFSWVTRPQAGFAQTAAAGIMVLMGVMLTLNLVAILIRQRASR